MIIYHDFDRFNAQKYQTLSQFPSKHINVSNFITLICNLMTQKEIKVEFCLSEDQVIDNFTKLFKVDTFLKNISNTSTISNFSTKKKKTKKPI